MPQPVSFFNLSLKKILHPGQSILDVARIRLLYYGLQVAFFAYLAATVMMFGKASTPFIAIALFIEVALIAIFKYLTWTGNWRQVSHALLILITVVNLNYVYIALQTVNILTIQLIVITIQFGFYMLGKRYGAFYTLLNAVPVFLFMALQYHGNYVISINPIAMGGVVSMITIITNFALIIYIHTHFFYRVFKHHKTTQKNYRITGHA